MCESRVRVQDAGGGGGGVRFFGRFDDGSSESCSAKVDLPIAKLGSVGAEYPACPKIGQPGSIMV